jgi:hypothetical protein
MSQSSSEKDITGKDIKFTTDASGISTIVLSNGTIIFNAANAKSLISKCDFGKSSSTIRNCSLRASLGGTLTTTKDLKGVPRAFSYNVLGTSIIQLDDGSKLKFSTIPNTLKVIASCDLSKPSYDVINSINANPLLSTPLLYSDISIISNINGSITVTWNDNSKMKFTNNIDAFNAVYKCSESSNKLQCLKDNKLALPSPSVPDTNNISKGITISLPNSEQYVYLTWKDGIVMKFYTIDDAKEALYKCESSSNKLQCISDRKLNPPFASEIDAKKLTTTFATLLLFKDALDKKASSTVISDILDRVLKMYIPSTLEGITAKMAITNAAKAVQNNELNNIKQVDNAIDSIIALLIKEDLFKDILNNAAISADELANVTQKSEIISNIKSVLSPLNTALTSNEPTDWSTVQKKATALIGNYKDFPMPEWLIFIHIIRKLSQLIIAEVPLDIKELANTLYNIMNIIISISANSSIDSAIFVNTSTLLKDGMTIYLPPTVEGDEAYISLQDLSEKLKTVSTVKASIEAALLKVLNSLKASKALEGVLQILISTASETVNKKASEMKAASTITAAQTVAINSVLDKVKAVVTLAKDKKWADLIKRIDEIVADYTGMKELPTWIKLLITAKAVASAINVVSGGKRLLHKKRRKTNRKRKGRATRKGPKN